MLTLKVFSEGIWEEDIREVKVKLKYFSMEEKTQEFQRKNGQKYKNKEE